MLTVSHLLCCHIDLHDDDDQDDDDDDWWDESDCLGDHDCPCAIYWWCDIGYVVINTEDNQSDDDYDFAYHNDDDDAYSQ